MPAPKGTYTTGETGRIYKFLGYNSSTSLFETYTMSYLNYREDGSVLSSSTRKRYLPISPANYIRKPDAYRGTTTEYVNIGVYNPHHPENVGSKRMYTFTNGK